MQTPLKIALIAIVLLYIFFILKAVKRKNMRIGYLIFWTITGILLIIALLIPNLVENISGILGFEMPINMIFSVAIFIINIWFNNTYFKRRKQKHITNSRNIYAKKEGKGIRR